MKGVSWEAGGGDDALASFFESRRPLRHRDCLGKASPRAALGKPRRLMRIESARVTWRVVINRQADQTEVIRVGSGRDTRQARVPRLK